jgi:virginiamycin B lyase
VPAAPSTSVARDAPNVANTAPVSGKPGTLIVRVTVPRAHLKAHYLSPATASITVKIAGPTNFKKSAALSVAATGCKSKLMSLVCTLVVPALKACPTKKNCYTGSVSTFDAAKHLLSGDQKFKFRIGKTPTVVPLVLYGVPASVAVMPGTGSNLTGTQATGFIEPKCSASAQTAALLSLDADGNYIVGVGSPSLSLASGDTSQLSVSNGPSAGTFVLSPPASPAYAYGGHTIQLTASATPPTHSGGSVAISYANVTYSGDICGTITEFALPSGTSAGPLGIVGGPDGAMWVTEINSNKIARMPIDGSSGTEFGGLTPSAGPALITVGPDHNLWFTEDAASNIARMTTSGTVTEFHTITANSAPVGIVAGPDGNLWFAESNASKIGVMSVGGTAIAEYPTLTASANPQGISAGPDGALWFGEVSANKIGRITTTGTVTETAIPTAASSTFATVTGSDGQVWFAECSSNKIGRVEPGLSTTYVDSEFSLPEATSQPKLLVLGPDGNVWFSEFAGNRIASISPTGRVTEYGVPTGGADPVGIAVGSDGAIWFTEYLAGKIGRIR